MTDRRKEACTDDSEASTKSITDSLRGLTLASWKAGLHLMSKSEVEKARPEYILNRMLSTKSAIPLGSALAELDQRAVKDASLRTFRSVGKGQTGTVYALTDTTMVIKLPNSPEQSDDLFNDFKNHKKVFEAFRESPWAIRANIHVPALKMWVSPKSNHFWNSSATQFAQDLEVPGYGLVSEYISPLQETVRAALVDIFAPKEIQARKHDFLRIPKNKDCLIRLYLGRRNDDSPPITADKFHLRNFPLHVNEMERLQLDTSLYTKLMAQALATLHWRAGLDANDVEFVFGSSPQVHEPPTLQDLAGLDKDTAADMHFSDFHNRTVSIWLLDFNMCKPFTKDSNGLKKLVDGFYWNDPYYPRPASTVAKDKELWGLFAKHYLYVSAEFVSHDMPRAFINAVEERGKNRSGNSLFG